MKVCIVGYGNMGKEIEKVLLQRDHEITARIDTQPGLGDGDSLTEEVLAQTDGVIEFALSAGVKKNAQAYVSSGTPAVVGTTGWYDQKEDIRKLVLQGDGAYLWGSNFSIGAHLLFALAAYAAQLIDPFPDYDIFAYEVHHTKKKDSPSGTAITLANRVLEGSSRKNKIVTEKLDRRITPDELHVASVRGGSVPGIHSLSLDSPADTVEIKHTARNRGGFALGAVMALEWLKEKKGFYQVEDFIEDLQNK